MCKSFDIGQCNCSHPGECLNAKWVKNTPSNPHVLSKTFEQNNNKAFDSWFKIHGYGSKRK